MVRIEPVKCMAGGMIVAVCSTLLMAFNECAAAPESSIYVQCPTSTVVQPGGEDIECIHLAAGDGQVKMADDAAKRLYIFSFSEVPLPGEDGAPTDPSLYAGLRNGLRSAVCQCAGADNRRR